jgi:predicted nucleic-acid-binding Zn-ribbon protein
MKFPWSKLLEPVKPHCDCKKCGYRHWVAGVASTEGFAERYCGPGQRRAPCDGTGRLPDPNEEHLHRVCPACKFEEFRPVKGAAA